MKSIERYMYINKKLRKTIVFGAATAGLAAGAYIGTKKIMSLIEDRRLSRYYDDEIEEIFTDEEKMKFYENEFIREEQEEQENLERAVNEFNSRRLRSDKCTHSSENRPINEEE